MQEQPISRRVGIVVAATIAVVAFVAGIGVAGAVTAQQDKAPPAYLVVSTKALDADKLEAYGAAAGPLARGAGIEVIAGRPDSTVSVLEGSWPYEEGLVIEKFKSMTALKEFWYSDGYQKAKKLREGALKVNFIVAVDGSSAD